jgi:hypothetical protein
MSSKELGTLAPPSGSPYAYMLQQKELLESRMAERLQKSRESTEPSLASRSPSPAQGKNSDGDSSTLACSRRSHVTANESRNRQRALRNQAVTNDLCEIVADTFIAESKLLNPSKYGVEGTSNSSLAERSQILKSVQRFVAALPSRYALGADTPHIVLLHMRLMAAVRSDHSRAVVHIMTLEDTDTHYWRDSSSMTNQKADAAFPCEKSRRLVTISCADADGLLEFITKLLATGGSRVLDADVMLSSDNIVLVRSFFELKMESWRLPFDTHSTLFLLFQDRFVVEMHGRLRLDKLANYIESFSEEAREKAQKNAETASKASDNSLVGSTTSNGPSRNVYYQPPPDTTGRLTPEAIREEMESAVPLTQVLSSRNSNGMLFTAGSFVTLRRHFSSPLPPISISTPVSQVPRSISSQKKKSSVSLPQISLEQRTSPEASPEHIVTGPEPGSMRYRRPLVNRQGNSDLDRIGLGNDDEHSVDYVTMDLDPRSGVENRVIPLIPFDELMLIETLGMGRVSTIYRAAWQRTSSNHLTAPVGIHMLALKVAMVNTETSDTSHVDELRREADIAARLRHPNICDLIGVAADSE